MNKEFKLGTPIKIGDFSLDNEKDFEAYFRADVDSPTPYFTLHTIEVIAKYLVLQKGIPINIIQYKDMAKSEVQIKVETPYNGGTVQWFEPVFVEKQDGSYQKVFPLLTNWGWMKIDEEPSYILQWYNGVEYETIERAFDKYEAKKLRSEHMMAMNMPTGRFRIINITTL